MTLHRQLTIAAAVMLAGAAATEVSRWPRFAPRLNAQICVERPENNGVMNIRESMVVIRGGPGLTLTGDEAACAYVEGGGKYTVWVQSRDPYDPSVSDPKAWRSSDLDVTVADGGRVELIVCARSSTRGYAGWVIQPAEKACE